MAAVTAAPLQHTNPALGEQPDQNLGTKHASISVFGWTANSIYRITKDTAGMFSTSRR
jgi:hypothetical protein